jgi:predicted nuclease of restriction endonuclease-like RecB superfamily
MMTSDAEALKWAQKAFNKLKESKKIAFRSRLEEDISNLMLELGVDHDYEATKIPYTIEHVYTPDFFLPNKHIYLEAKGYWRSADRRKIKTIKEQNPDLDLRMVFQNPFNTISKKSKTTYAQWCERHDIKWSSYHNLPLEWLI